MPLDRLTLKRRFRRLLGSSVEFDLAPYMARRARIDRLATEVTATDDAGLAAWARRLRTRVGEGHCSTSHLRQEFQGGGAGQDDDETLLVRTAEPVPPHVPR